MRNNRNVKWVLAGLVPFLFFCMGFGDKVHFLIRDGNREYHDGNYEEALKKYREAQVEDPGSDPIQYNIGNVFYRQGDYEKAVEGYNRLASRQTSELKTSSLYNKGNAHFRQGETLEKMKRLPDAADAYQMAAQSYKQALLLNPDDQESKYNLELTLRKLKDLENRQQKQDRKDSENQKPNQPQSQQDERRSQDQGEKKDQPEQKPTPSEPDKQTQNQKKQGEKDQQEKDRQMEQGEPPEERKMTPEEAQAILQALRYDEKAVQEALRKPQAREKNVEKDW